MIWIVARGPCSSCQPSDRTNSGRAILAAHPDSTGSLGIAISEAVEDAATRPDTNYALGSVLNHVCLHQTVIGLETKAQLAKIGEKADVLVACVGGGSNFGGFTFPYVRDKAHGDKVRIVAVEPKACPTLTRGKFTYDFGDHHHFSVFEAINDVITAAPFATGDCTVLAADWAGRPSNDSCNL